MGYSLTYNIFIILFSPDSADTSAPVFTYCPEDIVAFAAEGTTSTSVSWSEPTAVDNSGSVFYGKTHTSGDQFPLGSTTVVYLARDPSTNTASCTFTVAVTGMWYQLMKSGH